MAGENAIVAGGGATQTAKPVRFENERSGARVLTGGGVGGVRGLTTGGRRARSEQLRGRRLERLQALVGGLESVASRIASGNVSKHQRTILMTRFNDLQRQVNELDGIVAGEGLETRGRARLTAVPAIGGRRGVMLPPELQIANRQEAAATSRRLREFQQSFRSARQEQRANGRGIAVSAGSDRERGGGLLVDVLA